MDFLRLARVGFLWTKSIMCRLEHSLKRTRPTMDQGMVSFLQKDCVSKCWSPSLAWHNLTITLPMNRLYQISTLPMATLKCSRRIRLFATLPIDVYSTISSMNKLIINKMPTISISRDFRMLMQRPEPRTFCGKCIRLCGVRFWLLVVSSQDTWRLQRLCHASLLFQLCHLFREYGTVYSLRRRLILASADLYCHRDAALHKMWPFQCSWRAVEVRYPLVSVSLHETQIHLVKILPL